MVKTKIWLIIFFAAKDGDALYRQQKQDQELTVAQIMNSLLPNSDLKLKKVGKTTRPFRYDLNQTPYEYTVEVTNRFKELDLIECLKNYRQRFMTLYRRLWSKPSPRKRNAKRQNGCLRMPYKQFRREAKGKGEKERYTHLNVEFQWIARRDKKTSFSEQCKEIENNRMSKTRDLFKKIRDTKGIFLCKDWHNKGQKRQGPNRSRRD